MAATAARSICMKFVVASCIMAWLALGTGCFWANERSDSMYGFEGRAVLGSNGHLQGGQAHVKGGEAGLYVDVEANLRDAARPNDPDTHRAVGLGFSLRGSLFGILGTEHQLERYFDFGAELGGGGVLVSGGPHSITGVGSGWVGAWVDFGTVSLGSGYLALTGGIRRESFEDPWLDQTELAIGIAWRQRGPMAKLNLRD
jgi:hypothetical protein